MRVWIVVLGTFVTVAVLSLAYGVANKRYQAVVNERDESVRLGQRLSVNIDELQQRLTLTEGVLEGKVGDIRVLQATVDDKNLQIGQLEVSEAGLKGQLGALQTERDSLVEELRRLGLRHKELQVEHTALLQEKAGLEVTVLGLKTLSLDLQEKLVSKGKEYDALSSAVGTLEGVKSQVSGLQQQVQSLNGDIARLQAARAPLIVESSRGGFKCTGSMEPKITCLDEATWLTNFRPQDIIVGAVISFAPVTECRLSSPRVAHRVISTKVEAGTIYYRPKGDANSSDDGCWTPSSSVNGYIIVLYKNTRLENAPIRDRINALKAASDYALAVYDAANQTYKQKVAAYTAYVTLYCPGNVCPTQYYGTAVSLHDELDLLWPAVQQKYSQYIAAYDSYRAAIEIERLRL